jgi:predicted O-methyltransferase YrrM
MILDEFVTLTEYNWAFWVAGTYALIEFFRWSLKTLSVVHEWLFKKLGVEKRVNAYLGDAGEILAMMDGQFDFVFLDGPKAQYEKYLFDLKRLMRKGAILFADDVLLYGWVSGEEPTPQKRHSIVDKIRSYLNVVTNDEEFMTSVLNVGDGVALSVYLGEEKND